MFNLFRRKEKALTAPDTRGGWFSIVREPFAGAWQRNIEIRRDTVLAYHAVFACVSLIAGDISKMPLQVLGKTSGGIWQERENHKYAALLRKPNAFQTRIQFFECWVTSKLTHGNTYALKIRNPDGSVRELRILDPSRVQPMVSDDGAVFYQLQPDNIATLEEGVTVPAREIIHDRFNCLYHPLVGVSPIYACGTAAMHGAHIQTHNTNFFQNGGKPGGIIQVPGSVNVDKLRAIKDAWEAGYTGANSGRTAVLADGMEYKPIGLSASDSQVVEQMKLSAEIVCSVFHVPLYKVGLGSAPTYNNIEALDQQYYSQCLQTLIESIELLINEGLEFNLRETASFDLGALLRMDTSARYKSHSESIGGGWLSPNEARKKENLPPVPGGDSPYLQQQNYSLAALDKRDTSDDAFATPSSNAAPPELPAPEKDPEEEKAITRLILKNISRGLPSEY